MARIVKHSDPRGGHVRLYWEIIDSPAWRALSATDQRAYVALMRALRGSNNGDLSLPLSVARHHGITSKTTLAKNLRALIAVGLIAITRRGGATRGGQRLPNLYRVTDQPVHEMPAKYVSASPATNDWRRISSIEMGLALINKAEEAAKRAAQLPGQKLTRTGPRNEPVGLEIGSQTGPWVVEPGQKLTLACKPELEETAVATPTY